MGAAVHPGAALPARFDLGIDCHHCSRNSLCSAASLGGCAAPCPSFQPATTARPYVLHADGGSSWFSSCLYARYTVQDPSTVHTQSSVRPGSVRTFAREKLRAMCQYCCCTLALPPRGWLASTPVRLCDTRADGLETSSPSSTLRPWFRWFALERCSNGSRCERALNICAPLHTHDGIATARTANARLAGRQSQPRGSAVLRWKQLNAATNAVPHGPRFRSSTQGQASACDMRATCACV
jgi:hypothetical protein